MCDAVYALVEIQIEKNNELFALHRLDEMMSAVAATATTTPMNK